MKFPVQHLSDEAVAAFADGVLTGLARSRASRHVVECAECHCAVQIQREAAGVLRAAPAPCLPSGLVERLRALPQLTPVQRVPTTFGGDGTPHFPAHGVSMALPPSASLPDTPMTASVQSSPARGGSRLGRHLPQRLGVLTVAAAAVAISAVAAGSGGRSAPGSGTVGPTQSAPSGPAIMGTVDPALLMRTVPGR